MIAIKSIDNVEEFEILNDRVCIGNNNEITVYDKFFNILNKVNAGAFYMVKFCSNIVIQPKEDKRDRVIIINENHNHRLLDNIILLKNYIDKDFIYILDSNHTIGKYDCKLNKIGEYKNIGRFPKKIFNNYYIRLSDNISCYTIQNNQTLWQHSFSDLFETEQGAEFIFQNGNIIIHNGKLFFSLFENNRHYNTATFAIEIETGKVVNMYKGFAGNLTLFNNKIAVAVNEELRILNLDNNEITTRTFSFLKEKNITIGWNDFQISEDEKLYFIGNDHKQGTHFGIIDLQKDELLWLHSPNKNDKTCKVSIKDFKISDNRVFLHYSDNTLHIFEEEK